MKYKTKIQRRKIYQKVLSIFEKDKQGKNPYICQHISILINGGWWQEISEGIRPTKIAIWFPELLQQKPEQAEWSLNWWKDDQTTKRIKALKAAIELTYANN